MTTLFNRFLIALTIIEIILIFFILVNKSESREIWCKEWEHLVNYNTDYSCLKDIIDIK